MARTASRWAAVVVCWLIVGFFVAPEGIRVIYRHFLADSSAVSLGFLLDEWRKIVLFGGAGMLLLAGFARLLARPDQARRLVPDARPSDVGAIRILVCAILLSSVIWEDLPSTSALPREMLDPLGVVQLIQLLPGFEGFAASHLALRLFEFAAGAFLFLGMIGWRTRWTLPAGAASYLVFGGLLRSYAWFYHTGLVPLCLLIVLCFLPAGAGWSVDRWHARLHGLPVPPDIPSRRFGWARYALWTTLAIPYLAAGLSKLRNGGLTWWDASNFKFILLQSNLRPMEFDFDFGLMLSSAPDILLEALAITALAGEALFVLVLFSRRARSLLPAITVAMHVGILFLQNILFFDLILLQAILINWRPLLARIRVAVPEGTVAQMLGTFRHYLGAARWSDDSAVLHSALARIAASHSRAHRAGTSDDRAHGPGTSVGSAQNVSTRQDEHAPGRPPEFAGPPADEHRSDLIVPDGFTPERAFAGRRLTIGIATVLIACWVGRIEFYPFTGMQMFSANRGEPVEYERAIARTASGLTFDAPIEKSIPAMSDGRFRRILAGAFTPEKEPLAETFMQAVVSEWNNAAPAEDRITQIEIQKWRWYYESEPELPDYGHLVERITFYFGD